MARGERTLAMLKQGERDPLPFEEQTVVLYAVSNGYLDDVEPGNVPDWEKQFREYIRDSHGGILDSIRDEKVLSDENKSSLNDALDNFNRNYEPSESEVEIQIAPGGDEDEDEPEGES